MTTNISLNISEKNPSLCIPRVFLNISESRIRNIFKELNLGVIERVDIVKKTTEKGENFNRVFIHFQRWFTNENANTAKERLLNGKEIKIIYDDPWFWKVSAYRGTTKKVNSVPPKKKQPMIQFDSDEESPQPRKSIPVPHTAVPKLPIPKLTRQKAIDEYDDYHTLPPTTRHWNDDSEEPKLNYGTKNYPVKKRNHNNQPSSSITKKKLNIEEEEGEEVEEFKLI